MSLYAPTIVVNNVPIEYKPGSVSYKEGKGERNVRVVSSGGNQTSQIVSENIESQKGMIKFTMLTTADNVELIRQWQTNSDANAIEMTDRGGFSRTFLKAIITNDPDVNLGPDGEVEVEFTSRPAV